MSFRDKRLGLDLDRPSKFNVFKAYFNVKYFLPKSLVFIRETGHGIHIRAYAKINSEDKMIARANLGDDVGRRRFDEKRQRKPTLHHWRDTLFHAKQKPNQNLIKEERYNIFTDPFCSKLPAKKLRCIRNG